MCPHSPNTGRNTHTPLSKEGTYTGCWLPATAQESIRGLKGKDFQEKAWEGDGVGGGQGWGWGPVLVIGSQLGMAQPVGKSPALGVRPWGQSMTLQVES